MESTRTEFAVRSSKFAVLFFNFKLQTPNFKLENMIELTNVSKSFGELKVLQPTSLQVTPGRCTVLIGPSGCGKSTLLRLMIGLIEPDEGEVLFDGKPITPQNILECRQRMGYVIQDGGLFPHLTARAN